MDARTELLAYMGAAVVTVAALFGLQMWYASYLDVDVVHARSNAPINPAVAKERAKWQKALASAPVPIDKAKELLAQRGRNAIKSIAPLPSDDLSAMSGWMHRPNFRPYEPRKQPGSPEAAAPEAQPAADPAQVAAAAPAAPPPAAPVPARKPPVRAPRVAPSAHP